MMLTCGTRVREEIVGDSVQQLPGNGGTFREQGLDLRFKAAEFGVDLGERPWRGESVEKAGERDLVTELRAYLGAGYRVFPLGNPGIGDVGQDLPGEVFIDVFCQREVLIAAQARVGQGCAFLGLQFPVRVADRDGGPDCLVDRVGGQSNSASASADSSPALASPLEAQVVPSGASAHP